MEFEFRPDGKCRYANNSNYKNDTMIKKESMNCAESLIVVFVNKIAMGELRRIIEECEIMKEDDKNWPMPDKAGRQELEIVIGNEHISFTVHAPLPLIRSFLDV